MFENTKLEALQDGRKVVARSREGAVRADQAVLATNAYTKTTGRKRRAVAPLRVALFETEPLDESQLEALGWAGREGIYTAHEVLESYRLTPRNTIVGGSKVIRYAFGSGLAEGYDPAAFEIIERGFRQRFPALGELPVASWWGGWIGLTLDFLPSLGVGGRFGNVFHGIGFAGHGVAQATLMGAMLAERIEGREHEWEVALSRREISWPPEPVRWLGAKAITEALYALDRRTDRQIQRAESD